MFTDHVDISQAFVKTCCQETVSIEIYVFLPSAELFTLDTFIVSSSHFIKCRQLPERGIRLVTMSAFLEREGCETVGTWRVVIDGHSILPAHIDDFIIACAIRPVLYSSEKYTRYTVVSSWSL